MRKVNYDTHEIHYRVSGNGDPVVFLHGFLEDHTMWDNFAPVIESLGFKVILVDLPCHGKSRFGGEICTMSDMAKGVQGICQKESISNPHVIGHSMGGYVGLALLTLMPVKLTLLHSNFWSDPPLKQEDRNRVISIVEKNKMRLINEAIPHLFSPKNRLKCKPIIATLIEKAAQIPANEIIAATAGMRDRPDYFHLLEQYDIHIIHGDADPIIPTELLESELKKLTSSPAVEVIKNCGHMSIWEDSEALINSVKLILIK